MDDESLLYFDIMAMEWVTLAPGWTDEEAEIQELQF